MKTKTLSFPSLILIAFLLALFGCAERGDEGGDDVGPDAGDVDADDGDEVPPPESAAWPCRGGKDSGGDYFECNPSFIDKDDALQDYWVGVCSSEGINGYWSGPKLAATEHSNGWYRLYLEGTASDCELTVSQCSDPNNAHCWMQYGSGTLADDNAGPYRWCGGSDGDCAMKLRRNAGHTPEALGN